jgi:hypothetical protein
MMYIVRRRFRRKDLRRFLPEKSGGRDLENAQTPTRTRVGEESWLELPVLSDQTRPIDHPTLSQTQRVVLDSATRSGGSGLTQYFLPDPALIDLYRY